MHIYICVCSSLYVLAVYAMERGTVHVSVCVCAREPLAVRNQDHEFIQSEGSSTITSLGPTKTLAIGDGTRPDQCGIPALGQLLNCCESQAASG